MTHLLLALLLNSLYMINLTIFVRPMRTRTVLHPPNFLLEPALVTV